MSRFLRLLEEGTSEPIVTPSQLREVADEYDRTLKDILSEMPGAAAGEQRKEIRKRLVENCHEFGKLKLIELLT